MKKILSTVVFFTITNCTFSQITAPKTVLEEIEIPNTKQTNKTLIINTSNLSMNVLGELKDELINWKEKVVSININEKNQEFILEHNSLLSDRELFDVLRKYNIQKQHIASYK